MVCGPCSPHVVQGVGDGRGDGRADGPAKTCRKVASRLIALTPGLAVALMRVNHAPIATDDTSKRNTTYTLDGLRVDLRISGHRLLGKRLIGKLVRREFARAAGSWASRYSAGDAAHNTPALSRRQVKNLAKS